MLALLACVDGHPASPPLAMSPPLSQSPSAAPLASSTPPASALGASTSPSPAHPSARAPSASPSSQRLRMARRRPPTAAVGCVPLRALLKPTDVPVLMGPVMGVAAAECLGHTINTGATQASMRFTAPAVHPCSCHLLCRQRRKRLWHVHQGAKVGCAGLSGHKGRALGFCMHCLPGRQLAAAASPESSLPSPSPLATPTQGSYSTGGSASNPQPPCIQCPAGKTTAKAGAKKATQCV